MPIFTVGAAGTTSTSGYEVANSLRFETGSAKSLSLNPSTSASTRTFTYSFWTKRATNPSDQEDYLGAGGSADQNHIQIRNDHIRVRHYAGGHTFDIETDGELRDPSAWYHIVVAVDTTQGTDSNRIKIYLNGVQQTTFTTSSYPSQNFDFDFLQNGADTYIGRRGHSDAYELDCYLCEVVFIDGTQLDATSFGEFDSDSGFWKPIDVSGLTFGNAGFYLDFENSGSLGADVSGNGNNFTVNNMTSVDQSIDTCTNNYNVLNPLTNNEMTFTEGNLKTVRGGTDGEFCTGTFEMKSGKWYFESKLLNYSGNSRPTVGIAQSENSFSGTLASHSVGTKAYYLLETSYYQSNSATATTVNTSPATNDIYMWAFDLDNLKFYIGKNGSWYHSSDPSAGSNGLTIESAGYYSIATGPNDNGTDTTRNNEWIFNFGAPAYSISSGNSDGEGHGNFEYTVPTGFYAINSKNLAVYG